VAFRVLVVDDDPDTRSNLRDILELDGYEVTTAGTAAEALARDDWDSFGAILLDRRLPDATPDELLPRIRGLAPDAAVIMVTGYAHLSGAISAFRLGAADYLLKPIDAGELRARLGRIADYRQARTEVRESQEFARSVLDSLAAHIAVIDPTGTIIAVNAAWEAFAREWHSDPERCGVGINYLDVCLSAMGPDSNSAREAERGIRSVLDGERDHFTLEYPFAVPEKEFWFSLTATPLGSERRGAVVSHFDISARKRAEEELRETALQKERALAELHDKTEELRAMTQQLWQAARLAGVGELAASIAHELNNPLGTVSLRIEGILAKTPEDDPRHRPLVIVEQEIERMGKLVANLLQFSRAGRDQVSTVDVCEEVTRTIELTGYHLKRRQIEVEPDFAPETPIIFADRQQLRQVFLNLFTNAADAMPDGGRLISRVQPGALPPAREAVTIEVRDSGHGIPAEHLARVTDPFFTTKPEGQGTGLGLAICRRIVDQHQGQLQIESEVGKGTTVRVILPVRPDSNVATLHTL
jgi:signal transduction histidine kinase